MPIRKSKSTGAATTCIPDPRLLDDRTWLALKEIALREGTSALELLDEIARTVRSSRLLSATRLFVVEYYRSLLTETMARRH